MHQPPLDRRQRARLRAELQRRYPFVTDDVIGPSAVESGECDRCGAEARVVSTCGPIAWPYLGRRCVAAVGASGWCDGHAEIAAQIIRTCAQLPDDADVVSRLWWVSTGEVRLDPDLVQRQAAALALPL
ncbi:MAG TPA: hypothetical protein VM307_03460 [Egibacteraceae bacterium]|nr:hypothetical protein [Egibacteraceae bacterium]